MRIALFLLAIWLGGLVGQADAQCACAARSAGGYSSGYNGYVQSGAYYAPYATYSPYAN